MCILIALFTDFGWRGPYVGQVHAILATQAPGVPVIDLLHDAPSFDVRRAAYLLPACVTPFPAGTVFVCVVDPGVGGSRLPVVISVDGCWFVGPDNGIFEILSRRAQHCSRHEILWRPEKLAPSFHARDMFAPVAAMLALGVMPDCSEAGPSLADAAHWPDDLEEIIYVDAYGNLISGIRADRLSHDTVLTVGGRQVLHAGVFSGVPPGQAFWYENSNGLAEIAVNLGSAQQVLGADLGARIGP